MNLACPTTPATSTSAARPVLQKNCHCPKDVPDDNPGVEVVGRFAAQGVDEETLKALVFIHGAAQVAVSAQSDSFGDYEGGISQGCEGSRATPLATMKAEYSRVA